MKKLFSKLFLAFSLVSVLAFITGCNNKIEEASLTGTVILDESTDQNAGFLISIAGTTFQATTSSSGKFLIENIPVEPTYEILVIKGDFVKTWKSELKLTADEEYDLGTLNLTTIEMTAITDDSDVSISFVDYDENLKVVPTDRGIKFSYILLSNIYGRQAELYMTVKELDSGIRMNSSYVKNFNYYDGIEATYPFVEKNKKYNFHVLIYHDDTIVLEAYVTATSKDGLGEFKVTNADSIQTEFDNETKIISRSAVPTFTDNSNVVIMEQGCRYYITREKENTPGFKTTSWVWDYLYNEPFATNKIDLNNIFKISGWRTYESINNILSGHKCHIDTYTYITVNGYQQSNTVFYMNDTNTLIDDWGGDPVKVTVVYGVNENFEKDELEGYTGLPGTSVTYNLYGTATTFPFAESHYYGEELEEPVIELKLNGEKVLYKWKYGYDNTANVFPNVVTGYTYDVDDETILIYKLSLTTYDND